jgi:transcriptional regulator with XRE-family HTH domain
MSQLDLALAADISARHLSFLETGRSQPSREMVLRLGATLGVPLRDQNVMLDSAGYAAEFAEPSFDSGLPESISSAIERMLAQHEPFPMVVLNRRYDVLRMNTGAGNVLARFLADPSALGEPPNVLRTLFDPRLGRPFVIGWESVARSLLSRLHREALERPGDRELEQLLRHIFEYPDVPDVWRKPDFSVPSEPVLGVQLARDDLRLSFLTTLTVFNAPQNVTLEEVCLESYFPLDGATERACHALSH